eukprot:171258-Prymnesium_polylepis.1
MSVGLGAAQYAQADNALLLMRCVRAPARLWGLWHRSGRESDPHLTSRRIPRIGLNASAGDRYGCRVWSEVAYTYTPAQA